ncbi:MAG: pantoate--beta-alanine ligase [Actinobacteria bacterium RBG_16_64_13]|nr:MAG: pantoate--beta-alanine ligase [Actinobacteria bacterium RBG_16_64_13]
MSRTIPCATTIAEIRATLGQSRDRGATVGLVPTMGALHEGHLSLIRAARAENDVVVVSIFVNPTQFGPNEDLKHYPRDLAGDRALSAEAGADVIFNPPEEEMYPGTFSTWVEVEGLTDGLCGRSRPGHFRGMCTVVTKLFNICQPDRAYFGEKDAQQLAVIARMARNLDMAVQIVPCPTVREPDGLAMSSRNARLAPEQRAQAPALYEALNAARVLVGAGQRSTAVLDRAMRSILAEASLGEIDYLEIVGADDLVPVPTIAGECLIAMAVRFGPVRLIDNIRVQG